MDKYTFGILFVVTAIVFLSQVITIIQLIKLTSSTESIKLKINRLALKTNITHNAITALKVTSKKKAPAKKKTVAKKAPTKKKTGAVQAANSFTVSEYDTILLKYTNHKANKTSKAALVRELNSVLNRNHTIRVYQKVWMGQIDKDTLAE